MRFENLDSFKFYNSISYTIFVFHNEFLDDITFTIKKIDNMLSNKTYYRFQTEICYLETFGCDFEMKFEITIIFGHI